MIAEKLPLLPYDIETILEIAGKEVSAEKITIEEVLLNNGKYVGPTVGVSMLPMLKNRRDSIIVLPKTERLKPLDVALYRRGKKRLRRRRRGFYRQMAVYDS